MAVDTPGSPRISYRQQYRRCGKAACTQCAAGGRGHGPYWYAVWSEGGRTRTRYLGKAPPEAAEPHPSAAVATAVEADRPADTRLRVQTLGGFAVWRDGTPLPVARWACHRTGALFKWLLAAPGQRLARDEALELLWPALTPEAGAGNLRVLVHRLRRALGEAPGRPGGMVQFDGELLSLAPDGDASEWLDAAALEAAAARALAGRDRGAARAALALYTGDYLPDDPYDEWALARREGLRQIRVRLLLHLAGLCRDAGEIEEAIGCLHAVLAADRCHEDAALALMRLHVKAGRPSAALRVYRQLVEALREELDLAPGAAVQALATRVQAPRPAAPPPPPAAPPANLPAALTSFIGRQRELATLRVLLGPDHAPAAGVGPAGRAQGGRLLTLVGPGGVGKTRLALALAEELLEVYPDGVWLADLSSLPAGASLDDPLVTRTVAAALSVCEEATRPLLATLIESLRVRRLLLVIDNCEHLLPACAALVAALLTACPALRILATSRETLGVAGEQPWSVPPLAQPEAGTSPERLTEADAVRLFLARARVQQADLEITAGNAPALVAICRQLDGLPLALELAAARVGVLSVVEIAARLQEGMHLLSRGPRTAPARQRTLRATLDWSYGLLAEDEQRLLRRLTVFAGGCTLEAAEAVCVDEGAGDAAASRERLAAGQVLDALDGLARKSLLVAYEHLGACRYRLLETVRLYAAEPLEALGEGSAARNRHLAYFLDLAEASEPALRGPEQARWLDRLEREHDNLRAALRWAQVSGQALLGQRLAGALGRFWYMRGYLTEGRAWLEALLSSAGRGCSGREAGVARARALRAAGLLASEQGDYQVAVARYEEALPPLRALDDARGIAITLNNLGNIADWQGDVARSQELYEESVGLLRAAGDESLLAGVLGNLGGQAIEHGDAARATAWLEECLALQRRIGDSDGIAKTLTNLADVARVRHDLGGAVALLEESVTIKRELGTRASLAFSLNSLAGVHAQLGDLERAGALYRESLDLRDELGDRRGLATCLEGLALVALGQRHPEQAARLEGAAAVLRQRLSAPQPPVERERHEQTVAATRLALGEAAFRVAWEAGGALSLEETIACARAEPGAFSHPAGPG
jgi:predicted ATPase/DNA-binding SARP family transcriptional activator